MHKICAIDGCESTWVHGEDPSKIPMFNLPRNNDLRNKWFKSIDSIEINQKLKRGSSICIKHFEDYFIQDNNKLVEDAFPSLHLKKGNTLIDYEELLSQKQPSLKKKKRGTSGLMNLQIARKKKLMRRERMQKLAEKRRKAKIDNEVNHLSKKKSQTTVIHCNRSSDFFLGDRPETEAEKIIVSLRLTNLMQYLHDKKTTLCKHPSSIRDSKVYPMFNKIKNVHDLLENPIHWNKQQVLTFLEQINETFPKAIAKRFEMEDIDGATIMNLTKKDLSDYLKIDEITSEKLCAAFQQLRKETIMRYVNS